MILRQQPIASDLRNVTSALKIVTDLERIGDQAADIAEIIYHFEGKHAYRTVEHIPTMAKKAKIMVHEAIDAFIKKDLTTAQMVKDMDDEIDSLFEEVKQEVIEILKENSEKVDYCIDFLMIAKYLERVGDHAVNICEWLEFNQTGTVNQHRLIRGRKMNERIFVIEDDENIQEIVKLSLESNGYQVILFDNAIDAIAAFHEFAQILQSLMLCYHKWMALQQ